MILFDTNVILDFLLDREPFSETAAQLFTRIEKGEITGCLCATTVTTIHYLATKTVGERRAHEYILQMLKLFDVAPVTRVVLESALQLKFQDFQDAVIHEAARHAGALGVVTRDSAGFKKATIPIYTPKEFHRMCSAHEGDS